ncbi:tail assembly chaperone protein [Flavobacterium phage FPSV-S3]|nr:tail assembly chaperone protein [Flavobacterium phage FPSV-S3]
MNNIGFDIETSITKLREVKKKIETELVVYYPQFFPKNGNQNQTALRVQRINALFDSVIEDRDYSEQIFNIEKEILEDDKPNIWNVWQDNNMERVLEVDFQKFAISVTKMSGQNINDITTFTFYATVEQLKEENKKK